MNPEIARAKLLDLIENSRIVYKGLPLTGRELAELQMSVQFLYAKAKDNQEDKKDSATAEANKCSG